MALIQRRTSHKWLQKLLQESSRILKKLPFVPIFADKENNNLSPAPKAPDLSALGRSSPGPPGAAGAGRAPGAAPMFCRTPAILQFCNFAILQFRNFAIWQLAILQSCNLESISQVLVLGGIDAIFCK